MRHLCHSVVRNNNKLCKNYRFGGSSFCYIHYGNNFNEDLNFLSLCFTMLLLVITTIYITSNEFQLLLN